MVTVVVAVETEVCMLNVDVKVDGTGPGVIQADEVADDNDSVEDIELLGRYSCGWAIDLGYRRRSRDRNRRRSRCWSGR